MHRFSVSAQSLVITANAVAIAREHAHLPRAGLPLSQLDAELVLARENGFVGWQDLVKEVEQRLGKGLEWAVSGARHLIHNNFGGVFVANDALNC